MRRKYNHERAFWCMAKDYLKEMLPDFQEAERAISNGTPLEPHQAEVLQIYQSLGTLRSVEVIDESGRTTVETILEADPERMNTSEESHIEECLLVPIAYQLAVKWERSQPWPRYIRTCRNPECDRSFYTGTKDAVACPKEPHERGKSPCKKAWDNFSRWLVNNGHDPEIEWADDAFKDEYLNQHKPRGPQAPILRS